MQKDEIRARGHLNAPARESLIWHALAGGPYWGPRPERYEWLFSHVRSHLTQCGNG
jgi:hypothetical protein